MFGMGMTEILVILGLALLVIGPKKLPELARTLGKGFKEFQRASDDLRQSFTSEYSFEEERRKLRQEFDNLADSVTDLPDEKPSETASGEWQPPATETAEDRQAAGGETVEEPAGPPEETQASGQDGEETAVAVEEPAKQRREHE